jgi:hypothetical protein
MTTKLDAPLRRELRIEGRPYTVTLTPDYVKVAAKGRRIGLQLEWKELVNGDKALAVALNASLAALPQTAPASEGSAKRRAPGQRRGKLGRQAKKRGHRRT